jgi:hypothetical protein
MAKLFKGIKLNLQLFAGDDYDPILPDDFEDTSSTDIPTEDENLEIDTNEGEETPAAEGENEQPSEEQQQLFNVKYNKEEKQLTLDEMTRYAQMGMNYDKVQARLQELENDPRIAFVENLAKENGFTNPNEFLTHFQEMQEQAKLDELIQQNIPEEYAREMLENRKFREQLQAQQQQAQQQQQEQQQYIGLFEAFKEFNERDFDPNKDQIPNEVFEKANEEGIPLKYAYTDFMTKQLKQQLSIHKQNEQNLKRNVVNSTTQHGSSGNQSVDAFEDGFDSYFN